MVAISPIKPPRDMQFCKISAAACAINFNLWISWFGLLSISSLWMWILLDMQTCDKQPFLLDMREFYAISAFPLEYNEIHNGLR